MVTNDQLLVMVYTVGAWCIGILCLAAALTFRNRH